MINTRTILVWDNKAIDLWLHKFEGGKQENIRGKVEIQWIFIRHRIATSRR